MKSRPAVHVFKSLLFLSLIETVLWTLCLASASSAVSASGHAYLARETSNLRLAHGISQPGIDAIVLGANLHAEELERIRQLLFDSQRDVQSLAQLEATAEAWPSQPTPVNRGVPAPFAGIAAST